MNQYEVSRLLWGVRSKQIVLADTRNWESIVGASYDPIANEGYLYTDQLEAIRTFQHPKGVFADTRVSLLFVSRLNGARVNYYGFPGKDGLYRVKVREDLNGSDVR